MTAYSNYSYPSDGSVPDLDPVSATATYQAIIDAFNDNRTGDDLTWSDELGAAALYHAVDIERNSASGETGSNGNTLNDRIAAADYTLFTVSDVMRSQIIVTGADTAEDAITQWTSSSSAQNDIRNTLFTGMSESPKPTTPGSSSSPALPVATGSSTAAKRPAIKI